MSNNNILEPIPANFNEYLRKYDTVTLSDNPGSIAEYH